jgi:hypothetical protein
MSRATQLQNAVPWEDTLHLPVTAATLDMLFAGEIAGLYVPDFLTTEECACLKNRSGECEFEDYVNVAPRIEKCGITVFEFNKIGKKQYFEAVELANRRIERITNGICCPLQRVINWLATLAPDRRVNVAYEPGFGHYFAGLFRRIEEGTLIHVDFAPIEQPGWAIAQVCNQLTFNVYLDAPKDDPGVVLIWQKQGQPEHERFKILGSYGYEPEVVENIACATITPRTGMLMIINTHNFHQVSTAGGRRLAVSSAVGQLPDGDLVLWS